ncbi:hypothetical protein CBS101457_004925 [Exobasidium rhododendri]|nr:hypothetical protein CBS101457_004925 [Exobasidium rhododendri]
MRARWKSGGPRTLNRSEEEARQRDRQAVFEVEVEEYSNTTTGRLSSVADQSAEVQFRSFIELEQQNRASQQVAICAPLDAPFTSSPTPSQIIRFLEHEDSDFLRFVPG